MIRKIVTKVLAISLTFLLLREFMRIAHFDYAYSVIPGWHTPVYPADPPPALNTMSIVLATALLYGTFRLLESGIDLVWNRISKRETADKE